MTIKSSNKDRETTIKWILFWVVCLEVFITVSTLIYQQDERKYHETPISEKMASHYMDHPDKLEDNMRVAVRTSYTDQKKNYLLVKDHTVFHPFPWKGWALLSIGSPLGLFFLAVLIAKAYYQIVDHNEVPEENINDGSNWIMALNTLNKVNVVWLMLVVIVVLFTVWYIPEAIKYMGSITGEWIERYWVFPSVVLGVLLMVFLLWMLLQYKLKSKALNIEVEKFKYMQLEQQTKTLLLQEGPRDSQTDEKDEKDE